MTITIEQLKQKLEDLEAMFKAYEEQTEAEFPKDGDTYYYIDEDGIIYTRKYSKNDTFDQLRLSIGNYFRTQEEAEFTREQFKVIADMKSCGGVWKVKRTKITEYYLHIHPDNTTIGVGNCDNDIDTLPELWFPSPAAASKAIDTIGEERLLKYWFCVVKE